MAFLGINAFAQEYKPMLTDGKMWVYVSMLVMEKSVWRNDAAC